MKIVYFPGFPSYGYFPTTPSSSVTAVAGEKTLPGNSPGVRFVCMSVTLLKTIMDLEENGRERLLTNICFSFNGKIFRIANSHDFKYSPSYLLAGEKKGL